MHDVRRTDGGACVKTAIHTYRYTRLTELDFPYIFLPRVHTPPLLPPGGLLVRVHHALALCSFTYPQSPSNQQPNVSLAKEAEQIAWQPKGC